MNKPVPASPAQISDEQRALEVDCPVCAQKSGDWCLYQDFDTDSPAVSPTPHAERIARSRLEPVEAPKVKDRPLELSDMCECGKVLGQHFGSLCNTRKFKRAEPVEAVSTTPTKKCDLCGQPMDNGWRHAYPTGYCGFETLSCSAPSVVSTPQWPIHGKRAPVVSTLLPQQEFMVTTDGDIIYGAPAIRERVSKGVPQQACVHGWHRKACPHCDPGAALPQQEEPAKRPVPTGVMCMCCGHESFKSRGKVLCDYCLLKRLEDSKHQCKTAPIAPLLGQDELPPIDGYTWAKGVSTEDNTIRSYRKTLKQREAQLTQALTSLAAKDKEVKEAWGEFRELSRRAGASYAEMQQRAHLAEASLAEAQKRIKELEKELGR